MKKTSRRSFGKQITGALAILPIASLATLPGASAQTGNQEKPRKAGREQFITSHDTPPPVLIMDGSFIVETAEPDFDEKETVPGQRKKYKRRPKPGSSKVYLAHIKILDGSGEILYRGNYHDDATDLRIAVLTEDGIVNLASVSNKLQLDTPPNKNFFKDPLDQPIGNVKRKGRFRYKDDSNGRQHRIKNVKVKKGPSTTLFEIDFPNLDEAREIRIMIWLAEV